MKTSAVNREAFVPLRPFGSILLLLAVIEGIGIVEGARALPAAGLLSVAISMTFIILVGAAAIMLYGIYRVEEQRPLLFLSAAFLGSDLFGLATMAVTPPGASIPPLLHTGPQTAAWLHTSVYAYLAIVALIYSRLRQRQVDGHRIDLEQLYLACSGAIVAAALTIAAVAIFSDHLPTLVRDGGLTGVRETGIGYVLVALLVTAMVAVMAVPQTGSLCRALTLTLLALTLDVTLTIVHPERYTVAYYAGRLLTGFAASFVLTATIVRLLQAYQRLKETRVVLRDSQRFATRQSDRLSAVWRLVQDQALDDRTRFQAILGAGAAAIRPGQLFFGFLSHLEGDELVIDYNTAELLSAAPGLAPYLLPKNGRAAVESTIHAEVLDAGRTIGINDLDALDPAQRTKRTWGAAWRSMIGTSFALGSEKHFVVFTSQSPTSNDPFNEEDYAFIDVIASFFATQFHQARQLAQIRYQIEHDQLTGLPTRAQFRAATNKNIALGIPTAIAVLDIDRFREINETFGHMIGDALLVEISAALNHARQSGDVVARLAGDNFAILIDDVQGGIDVDARLRPYRSIFDRPFVTGDRTGKESLRLGASFGVALFPQDASTFEELLSRADASVDVAKRNRRGRVAYYNDALMSTIDRRRVLRIELAGAIAAEQFVVAYQPTIVLATMATVGAEALVRWNHPQHGVVMPDDFIGFAEDNGLIADIGRCVMQRVLADIDGMPSIPPGFKAYINLSSHQLGDLEFASELRDQFARFPRARDHIAIEVTETVAMQNVEKTIDALTVLRELGVQVALDDFGTGYSSLSYLKRLPIDVIKIDRSFVAGLPHDPHDVAIVDTLITVANSFRFKTLAEGVETAEQMAWLREHGCTYGQGYAIAYPMPFDELVVWLDERALIAESS